MATIFKDLNAIDNTLTRIRGELKGSFADPEILAELAAQLDIMHTFIQKLDNLDQGPHVRQELNKHKDALISLFGRWQTLFVDAEVTEIAEKAQMLSESKGNVQDQLVELEKQIKDLCFEEALSIENQLMITLARRFIAKALGKLEHQAPVMQLNEEAKGAITEHLFDIATMLHEGHTKKGLNLFHMLSENVKSTVLRHLNILKGDVHRLETSENLAIVQKESFKMIQALLASIKSFVQGVEDHDYADAEMVDALLSSKPINDSIM